MLPLATQREHRGGRILKIRVNCLLAFEIPSAKSGVDEELVGDAGVVKGVRDGFVAPRVSPEARGPDRRTQSRKGIGLTAEAFRDAETSLAITGSSRPLGRQPDDRPNHELNHEKRIDYALMGLSNLANSSVRFWHAN